MGAPVDGQSGEDPPESDGGATGGAAVPPLDSIANLRLLGEVQRRGLDAANAVIARLTERTGSSARPSVSSDPVEQIGAVAEAFVDAVLHTAGAAGSGGVASSVVPRHAPGAATVPEVLSTRAGAGERTEVELWLHNYTEDHVSGIAIHAGELVAAGGERLPASCVTFHPADPVELSASSSRSVQVRVEVPEHGGGGTYRGILCAGGLSDLWVVLEVEVAPGADRPSR